MSRSRAFLAAVLAGLSLLVSGCGGSKAPSVAGIGTATPRNAAGGGAGSGSAQSQTQLQLDALKYAECMRADGVPKFPDPRGGGGFVFPAGAGIDPSSPAFKAAQAKCLKLMPGGGPPGAGSTTHPSAQWLAHMVK